jgi:hypothetical protein
MKGTRPGRLPPPSRAEGADGRICAQEGCETKLSVYNDRELCWQHSDLVFPNYRGKRLTDPRG